jgi:hypothetical protein
LQPTMLWYGKPQYLQCIITPCLLIFLPPPLASTSPDAFLLLLVGLPTCLVKTGGKMWRPGKIPNVSFACYFLFHVIVWHRASSCIYNLAFFYQT